MQSGKKYLIYFSILFGLYYFGCSSGEYELEEHQIDYIEKTLKFDTVKTVSNDTTNQNNKKIDNTSKESYVYIVQIGAFIVKSNFDRFIEKARQVLGDQVFYELRNNLYRIRIGNYSNKAEALRQLDYVKDRGYYDAFIVTVKK
jgi:cell division septation protein DedD